MTFSLDTFVCPEYQYQTDQYQYFKLYIVIRKWGDKLFFFKFNFHLCLTRGRTRLLNILASSIWTLKTFYLWISCIHFNSFQFFWMIIFPHFPSLILSLNKPSVWSQPQHLSAYGSPHSLWHIRASLDPPENITINTQQMMGRDQRGLWEISQLIKISDLQIWGPMLKVL